MRTFWLCCLWCFGIAHGAIAQQGHIDSLKHTLQQARHDSTRANLLNRLFFNYIFLNTDSAVAYATRSFALNNRLHYKKGLATYYNHVGVLNRVEGDYLEAVENLLQSLKINETLDNGLAMSDNYVNIGLVYAAESKYDLALDYYQKGLRIKEAHKDTMSISFCYKDMGDAYNALGKYREAIKCYQQVMASSRKQGLTFGAMMSLGGAHLKMGELETAYQYVERAVPGLTRGNIYELATAYNILGKVKAQQHAHREAAQWFRKAARVAFQYKNNPQLLEAYRAMADCHYANQMLDSAYICLRRYASIQDSLSKREGNAKIARLQNNFALRKKQNEIEAMQKEQGLKTEKQRMFTNGVLFFALMACGLLLVFYNSDRKTRKANRALKRQTDNLAEKNAEINRQKEEIRALNETLEARISERTHELDTVVSELHKKNQGLAEFSYIVAHNIRAPMASIKGLLSLIDYTQLSAQHLEVWVHIQKTIEVFELVVDDLDEILEIQDTQQIALEVVSVGEIMGNILKKFRNEIRRNKSKIHTDFQDLPTIYTNKHYLHEVLFHLLSNAIKYQSNARALEVYVGTQLEEGYAVIEVRDNGMGIDLTKTDAYKIFGMHQRLHTHVEGKGFGLYLVKKLIDALHGKIVVDSELNKGTSFKVYLPCLPEDALHL